MEQDIRESKEYRLAKEWEMAVNSYATSASSMTPSFTFRVSLQAPC